MRLLRFVLDEIKSEPLFHASMFIVGAIGGACVVQWLVQ